MVPRKKVFARLNEIDSSDKSVKEITISIEGFEKNEHGDIICTIKRLSPHRELRSGIYEMLDSSTVTLLDGEEMSDDEHTMFKIVETGGGFMINENQTDKMFTARHVGRDDIKTLGAL